MTLEEFSRDDFDLALKRTIRILTCGKNPSPEPQAILLGGKAVQVRQQFIELNKRNFKGISLLLMGIAIALSARIILLYRKDTAKIALNIPNNLQEKW
ncbi:hypothetical protein [Staphylococcus americanisciuri]|uniref:Uncharacterized protein n=1 Tax=Staphylococcus americanisciuri TaxID=2973940 RepID=A0ABT2F359_9STAP|nr:hypothetical protein [Staphylococcus americanisciuri]MCS4486886.1 hypothetical protein [Staphylococcus americanisciuri]